MAANDQRPVTAWNDAKVAAGAGVGSAICALIASFIAFAGILRTDSEWLPWVRSTVAVLLSLTALAFAWTGLSYFGIWNRLANRLFRSRNREEEDRLKLRKDLEKREEEDWLKLRKALEELIGIPRSLCGIAASGVLDPRSGRQVAETLLRGILVRAQRALEIMCKDVVCSLKLLRWNRVEKKWYFDCLYAQGGTSAHFDKFVAKFPRLDLAGTYAEKALTGNLVIFVPDLWAKENGDSSNPFSPQLAADLRTFGVKGLVVAPISLDNLKIGQREAKLVFKVDTFTRHGLVQNEPTRLALEFVVEMCALALQLALTREIISIEDLEGIEEAEGASDD